MSAVPLCCEEERPREATGDRVKQAIKQPIPVADGQGARSEKDWRERSRGRSRWRLRKCERGASLMASALEPARAPPPRGLVSRHPGLGRAWGGVAPSARSALSFSSCPPPNNTAPTREAWGPRPFARASSGQERRGTLTSEIAAGGRAPPSVRAVRAASLHDAWRDLRLRTLREAQGDRHGDAAAARATSVGGGHTCTGARVPCHPPRR